MTMKYFGSKTVAVWLSKADKKVTYIALSACDDALTIFVVLEAPVDGR